MSLAAKLAEMQEEWIASEIGRDWTRRREAIPSTIPNRSHSAGHPCMRRLVYARMMPAEADPTEEALWSIFHEGHSQHRIIRQDLEAMGVRILAVERPVSWPKLELSGTIDLVLDVFADGRESVWDAKGYSPHLTIRDLDDVRSGPWYLRVAFWQVQLYKLLLGVEEGGFILKNKGSSRLTFLDVPLELDGVETILRRLELVNQAVKKGSLPDREPGGWCQGCDFFRACGPPSVFGDSEALMTTGAPDVCDLIDLASDRGIEEKSKRQEEAREKLREIAKQELSRTHRRELEIIGLGGRWLRAKKARNGSVRVTWKGGSDDEDPRDPDRKREEDPSG